jgi:hypothetical protein
MPCLGSWIISIGSTRVALKFPGYSILPEFDSLGSLLVLVLEDGLTTTLPELLSFRLYFCSSFGLSPF